MHEYRCISNQANPYLYGFMGGQVTSHKGKIVINVHLSRQLRRRGNGMLSLRGSVEKLGKGGLYQT